MNGKGRELADMVERRRIDILCVQETRWKGSKFRCIGGGCKLFYDGVDGERNGVGIILKGDLTERVLEVKRVSDRMMSIKLEIEGVMMTIISAYAPQVGFDMEEIESFWRDFDEAVLSVSGGERIVIGADLNGHVGEGNSGDEVVIGRYGFKERSKEGKMEVDLAKRMEMELVNTYFRRKAEHRISYKSDERSTQVD